MRDKTLEFSDCKITWKANTASMNLSVQALCLLDYLFRLITPEQARKMDIEKAVEISKMPISADTRHALLSELIDKNVMVDK